MSNDYVYPLTYKARVNLAIREQKTPTSPSHGNVRAGTTFEVVSVTDTKLDVFGRVTERWALRPDGYFCAVIFAGVSNAELVKSSATPGPATPPAPQPPPDGASERAGRIAEIDEMIRYLTMRRMELTKDGYANPTA